MESLYSRMFKKGKKRPSSKKMDDSIIGAGAVGALNKKYKGTSNIPKGEVNKLIERVKTGIEFEKTKRKIKRNYGNTKKKKH